MYFIKKFLTSQNILYKVYYDHKKNCDQNSGLKGHSELLMNKRYLCTKLTICESITKVSYGIFIRKRNILANFWKT